MRQNLLRFMTVIIILGHSIWISLPEVHAEGVNEIKLTKKQKEEISLLHRQVIEQKKEIVNKYVEYGVISQTKAGIIIANIERKYKKLAKNDFVPKIKKGKEQHHEKNNRAS